ncbi:exodeoxyribonuclease 7 large subunit [Propionigenium maris DSM 9537]|uniref:Exodeoxyribonuclease 7 large subunit n=1 Tax=Propionigenium maris DSM 9537 TaxID=1123000 RepID=A0A9W6LMU1_9FUSO|nr:exodeoxyribonuclease VII large subunit [Propionigenium maris]GLI56179.1 exodeoxyribonuclease 7 large subunit [Propionigenium maris DSM 9537]
MQKKEKIYTVSQLNREVKSYLEGNENFQELFLKGEMSGVNYYKSGHLYFTLKDKKAQVKCAAFNYKYKRIAEDLKEGDVIKLFGDVTLYEARGDYQVLVRHIEKENQMGALFEELEKNKREMAAAGYFDEKYKQKLPKVPQTIGIVTSGTGAAVRDIINTAKLRFPNINIYVYPAKVQGEGASQEIIKGIQTLDNIEEIDVIIAGRGGGSIEDLWCFNEKEVALAYFNAKKPIVSAVGHEIDFLLTDLVADLRASTPTHASEKVVPEKRKLQDEIENRERYMKTILLKYLDRKKHDLIRRQESYGLKGYLKNIRERNVEVTDREEALDRAFGYYLAKKKQEMDVMQERLSGVDPTKIMQMGYSITTYKGKAVKDSSEIPVEGEIETVFSVGRVKSIVKEKM